MRHDGRVVTTRKRKVPSLGVATTAERSRDGRSVERTFALVGDRWTFLVLRAALGGTRRFDQFCGELGIARPILAQRLRKLVDGGLMTRQLYQEHPPRYEYVLSEAGASLSPILAALVRWGDQHLGDADTRTRLVHSACGSELVHGFWCDSCMTLFGPDAVGMIEH